MSTYIEFQPSEKYAKSGADTSDSIDTFRDCGILLEDDIVVVDIDCLPKDTISNMIEFFNIKTKTVWTDRGVHLYFKKPRGFKRPKDDVCRLGFKVELKDSKNRPTGLTVKRNGVKRKVEREDQLEFFNELFKTSRKYESLVGLGEGDGRNEKLFKHKGMLSNCEGWERILRFINNYIFEVPLDDKEYEVCTRQSANSSVSFDEIGIAKAIVNEYKTVEYMGTTWFYDGTRYVSDNEDKWIKRLILNQCDDKKTTFMDEVLKQVKLRSKIISDSALLNIKFKNGVLDSKRHRFIESDYESFTPYYIDIDYKEDAKPVQIVDDYLNQLSNHDVDYRKHLEEALGYIFILEKSRISALAKFFFFIGDGGNGKGTLLNILSIIFNEQNCTTMDIDQLSDERYLINGIGKLANLGDDVKPKPLDDNKMRIIKNITTCDNVDIRRLYHSSEKTRFTMKLYFTTNSIIKSYEKGYSYVRRVEWLPMYIKVEKPDPNFLGNITTKEALEYWVRLLMEGYHRLIDNGKFTDCQRLKEFNGAYHESNNVMLRFVKECDVDNDIIGSTMNELKDKFDEWNDDEAKFSPSQLKKVLWDEYQIGIGRKRAKDSVVKRVFLRQSETSQDLSPK